METPETPIGTEQTPPVVHENVTPEAPTVPEPPQSNPAPQPKKKKSKKKLWITLGIVAAVLAAAAAVWFFVFHTSSLPFKPDTSLIPVYDGKKWGYIDQKGNYVINPQFSDADWFSDGLARVEDKDGKIGFIDEKGTYIIPSKYVNATPFHEGLAFVVEEGGCPVCIDKKGERAFECTRADGVFCFCEGMAAFYTTNDKGEIKYGYYDKKGNVVINPQFKVVGPFQDGLAVVCNDEDKWGYIDTKGKYVINPQFDRCGSFYDGLASFESGDKWGYIDKEGKYVINPQFDAAGDFYNGLAVVRQGEKFGYIDKEGKFVINPQFEDCSGFTFGEGLALFMTDDEKFGYIDKEGKYAINPQFDDAREFCDGIAFVESNGKWGIIDKKGQYVVNPQFERIKSPYLNIYSSVRSEYYDASKFLSSFLKNFSSSKVDGMPVDHLTLKDIASHDVYGERWEANLYYTSLYVRLNDEITNDITLNNVSFLFTSATYSYGDYYDKTYDFTVPCSIIVYEFSLKNKAADRSKSVWSALGNKLKSIYGGTLSDIKQSESSSYMKKLECGNINFIIGEENGECFLSVFLDENTYRQTIRTFEARAEHEEEKMNDDYGYEEYDDYYYDSVRSYPAEVVEEEVW